MIFSKSLVGWLSSSTWKHLALAVLTFCWAHGSACRAQVTGIEVVVDTAFYGPNTPTADDTFDPTGILDGYVSYLVYVNMTNPTDVMSAVFSDTSVLPQGGALGIDAECECWNPIAESMVLDGTNSSLLWTIEPLWQYDTFWTIGKLSSDMPGDNPSWLSNPSVFGDAICGTEVTNGSVYVLGAPVNAIAGDDLRVLVARVTTCGDWSLNLNVQVFPEGDPSNPQQYFVDTDGNGAIEVSDPCAAYDSQEAAVEGNVIVCAGELAEVSLEFLGLEEDVENTTYTVVSSTNGFATESLVGEYADNVFPGLDNGDYRVYVANEYGCHDTTAFQVTTTDIVETPFGIEAPESALQGNAQVPDSVGAENGLSFPVGAWAVHDGATEFYWLGSPVDDVVVEGCSDGAIRVSRDSSQAMQTDTVHLQITGSAEQGADYLVSLGEIVMEPGVLDTLVSLQVVDDGVTEGAEDVLISQSFVNSCGDTALSSVRLVILDPIPMNANAMDLACEGSDSTQLVGFENITGFGPLSYAWGEAGVLNGSSGMLDSTSVLENGVSLVDQEGHPLANATVNLTLTDQCGDVAVFEQNLRRAVVVPAGWCVDSTHALPVFNGDIPVLDLTLDGMSLLGNDLLQDTLAVHATQVNGLWTLDSLTTGSVDWSGTVTLVDSCGRSTSAEWYVLEYACTEGCTDNAACNFTGEAGIEDGSCTYPGDSCDDGDETTLDETLDDNCDCVVATDEVIEEDVRLSVLPNPSKGQVLFQSNVDVGAIRIVGMDGRVVREEKAEGLIAGVHLNLNLPNGLYLCELNAGPSRFTIRLMISQ